jgi:hypothetical protein
LKEKDMLTLKDTERYYVYSHLQALQDYQDELEDLYLARNDAMTDGATAADIEEIDFLIHLAELSILEIKSLAN